MVALAAVRVASVIALRPGVPHRTRRTTSRGIRRMSRCAPPRSRRHSARRRVFSGGARCPRDAPRATTFRLIAFSVQRDHLHLIVEADSARRLMCGVSRDSPSGWPKAVNRVLGRRGRGVGGSLSPARRIVEPARRPQRSGLRPAELAGSTFRAARGLDPCSSAAWFSGWRVATPAAAAQVAGRGGAHMARALGLAEAWADRRA